MELCKNEHLMWGTKNISGIETLATVNICAIPFLTKNNVFRSGLAASAIDKVSSKFVAVQEAFDTGVTRNLRRLLPHYHKVQSGRESLLNRGGLMTLSKDPIIRWQYTPFKDQGSWRTMQLTDRIGGKGFLVIETKDAFVVNAHFTALYLKEKSQETFEALNTQRAQLLQTKKFIRTSLKGKLVVFMGDLNFPPRTDLYEETTRHFMDLTHGIPGTWSSKRNQHRGSSPKEIAEDKLDYILVYHSKGLKFIRNMFEKIKVSLFDDESAVLSDHHMVLASEQ
jgi:endonuclease/exonuclease/phosphatase family metal-dependent hydrolase